MSLSVPFLLGMQHIPWHMIANFNIQKKKQDKRFKPLQYRHDIDREACHALRTDPLWPKLLDAYRIHLYTGRIRPHEMFLANFWDCEHVRIQYVRPEDLPHIVVEEDDGRERICYNRPLPKPSA